MQKRRNFRMFALIGAAAAVMGGSSAIAQEHRGTMEQQMACTPDVFRLCGAAIPDENRIVACLQANTPQLSGPCRAVFESNDSAKTKSAMTTIPVAICPAVATRRAERSGRCEESRLIAALMNAAAPASISAARIAVGVAMLSLCASRGYRASHLLIAASVSGRGAR